MSSIMCVFKEIGNIIDNAYESFIENRQRYAEAEIARILHKTEYPRESYESVLYMVRKGKFDEVKGDRA